MLEQSASNRSSRGHKIKYKKLFKKRADVSRFAANAL
jgi:hypothetical protein